jgi:hypothetical protein
MGSDDETKLGFVKSLVDIISILVVFYTTHTVDSPDSPLRRQGFRRGSAFLATSGRIYLFDYALMTMITRLLSRSPKGSSVQAVHILNIRTS